MKFYLIVAILIAVQGCSDIQNPTETNFGRKINYGDIPDTPKTFRTKFILKPGSRQTFSHLVENLNFKKIGYCMFRNLNLETKRDFCDSITYFFTDQIFHGFMFTCLQPGDSVILNDPPYDLVGIDNRGSRPLEIEVFIMEL